MSIYSLRWKQRRYIRLACSLASHSQHLEELKLRLGHISIVLWVAAAPQQHVFLFSGQVVGVVKQSPPPRRGPRFERLIARRWANEEDEEQEEKKKQERRTGPAGMRLVTISELVVLLSRNTRRISPGKGGRDYCTFCKAVCGNQ